MEAKLEKEEEKVFERMNEEVEYTKYRFVEDETLR
jgi:hypothetical protein